MVWYIEAVERRELARHSVYGVSEELTRACWQDGGPDISLSHSHLPVTATSLASRHSVQQTPGSKKENFSVLIKTR